MAALFRYGSLAKPIMRIVQRTPFESGSILKWKPLLSSLPLNHGFRTVNTTRSFSNDKQNFVQDNITDVADTKSDENMEAEDIVAKEDFLKRRRKFESLDKIELPSRVERVTFTHRGVKTKYGTRIFIIGTCQVGTLSKDDVTTTIRAVEPDVVMIESCDRRNKRQNYKRGVIRDEKDDWDGSGGEFRRAFQETELLKKKKSCELYLGDRPIQDTRKRFWGTLTLFEKLIPVGAIGAIAGAVGAVGDSLAIAAAGAVIINHRMIIHHLMRRFSDVSFQTKFLSKEEIEKREERRKAENSPVMKKFWQVTADERDIWLAHSLHKAEDIARRKAPKVEGTPHVLPSIIVGVVGMAHQRGIIKNLQKLENSQLTIEERQSMLTELFKLPPDECLRRFEEKIKTETEKKKMKTKTETKID